MSNVKAKELESYTRDEAALACGLVEPSEVLCGDKSSTTPRTEVAMKCAGEMCRTPLEMYGFMAEVAKEFERELTAEKKLSAAISRDCNATALERNALLSSARSSTASKCCTTGQPCTVEPCARCPEHPVAEFHVWLDTYGPKAGYDRGDMAACWHAAQRALTATRTEELSSPEKQLTSDAARAIDLTKSLLREMARRHPVILQDTDIEAFILNELNPAKVAANKDRTSCYGLMGLLAKARRELEQKIAELSVSEGVEAGLRAKLSPQPTTENPCSPKSS